MDDDFSDDELRRYARHIVLPEIGGTGQLALRRTRVLIVGLGGLGGPLALYLAAAGIGTLGLVDDDRVDLSNLQRQVLFDGEQLGRTKLDAAVARLERLDPGLRIVRHAVRLDNANAAAIVAGYDLVADGSDNLPTREAVHDACADAGIPLVSAAVQGLDGQLTTYKSFLGAPHPCLRCLAGDVADADALPTCAQAGVLGPAAGVMATLQAVEVVKEILDLGTSLSGTLVLYDALGVRLDRVTLRRPPACAGACVRRPGAKPPVF